MRSWCSTSRLSLQGFSPHARMQVTRTAPMCVSIPPARGQGSLGCGVEGGAIAPKPPPPNDSTTASCTDGNGRGPAPAARRCETPMCEWVGVNERLGEWVRASDGASVSEWVSVWVWHIYAPWCVDAGRYAYFSGMRLQNSHFVRDDEKKKVWMRWVMSSSEDTCASGGGSVRKAVTTCVGEQGKKNSHTHTYQPPDWQIAEPRFKIWCLSTKTHKTILRYTTQWRQYKPLSAASQCTKERKNWNQGGNTKCHGYYTRAVCGGGRSLIR